MQIGLATTTTAREQCFALRRMVFMGEQGVTADDEWDGFDDTCHHFLARDDSGPIATARLRTLGDIAKIQRVAVIKSHRGTGLGRQIMQHLLAFAGNEGFAGVTLEAQTHAIAFYETLGFTAEGPEFDDAGIPHRRMSLSFLDS